MTGDEGAGAAGVPGAAGAAGAVGADPRWRPRPSSTSARASTRAPLSARASTTYPPPGIRPATRMLNVVTMLHRVRDQRQQDQQQIEAEDATVGEPDDHQG